MATVTIETTPEQDAALAWLADQTEEVEDGATYLQNRMQDVLNDYVRQHRERASGLEPGEGLEAFASATPEQQQAALQALGYVPRGQRPPPPAPEPAPEPEAAPAPAPEAVPATPQP